jgi:hypothetical protein
MPSAATRLPPETHDRMTKRWTDEDIADLMRFWRQGLSNEEIADRLDRNQASVAVKASRLGLKGKRQSENSRSKTPQMKTQMRPCMSCRAPFPSEGTHHRICNTCKSGEMWSSGSASCYAIGGY